MAKILLEGDIFEFVPDRAKLTEALSKSERKFPLTMPGKFSLADSVNGNNRRYPWMVWKKNIEEGSPLQDGIAKRRSLGLLEHPGDGKVSYLSPISHIVTRVWMEGKEVAGEITLINTPEGHRMAALIEAGHNPCVSSRGYGSVVRAADGVDEVQDDFVCESWDLVYNPSFTMAVMNAEGVREAAPAKKTEAPATATATTGPITFGSTMTLEQMFASLNEQINSGKLKATSIKIVDGKIVLENEAAAQTASLTESVPFATGAASGPGTETPASPANPNQTSSMEIKAIREAVQALANTDVSKLDPRRLSEGLNQMTQLHREVAALEAKDATLSWDAGRLHSELDTMEKAWTESAKAPAESAAKLQESQTRTLKILRETANICLTAKTRLQESLKREASAKKLTEEVARRGRGWRSRALRAESKLNLQQKRLDLAYESLDEFARRYHEDTTKLAKHAIMLEHGAKIKADEALLKKVNEAKRVDDLTAIRESITGKKPVTESKKPAKAPAPAATEQTVKVESLQRPFTVTESVAAAARLTAAAN